MRFSRDILIFILLVTLLIGLAVVSAIQRAQRTQQENQQVVPLSSHSADATGALALQKWLDAAGFRTTQIENQDFQVTAETRALVILSPYLSFDSKHMSAITSWVERGNTLIVAEEFSYRSDRLLSAFKVKLNNLTRRTSSATLELPLLGNPRGGKLIVQTTASLLVDRSDYVTYLSAENAPLLVSFPQGKGRVWFSSAPRLFDNENLTEDANAALVMAMFSSVPRGGLIAFDEYHKGLTGSSATDSRSLQQLVFGTPWGWGIVYAIVIIFGYLIVNGKRFGRVVPLPKDVERRSPAEYVTSMANLYRRAKKRGLVAHHYHRQLKRVLGKPYRINVDLPDEEFVEELSRYRDQFDRDKLLKMLRALDQKNPDERSLVKLADQAIQFTKLR